MLINRKPALKAAAVLALLLAVFFPAKYINSVYGYLPGLGMLSLLLLSLLYFLIIRRSLRFETEAIDVVCQRGETVNAALKIRNRSVLACPKTQAFLSVSDFFGGEDAVSPMTFAMYGKSETEFPFRMKMDHIGVYTCGIKLLKIYDPLGVFSIAVRGGGTFPITVIPKTFPAEEIRLEERQLTESRNISKSAVSDGFDYTGVREYALGDPMKRIHWKLSAHSSAYMTRITESSRKNDLTVVIDFVPAALDREVLPDIYDCLAETALSLIEQASSKDVEYSLLFIGRDRELNRMIPKGDQDYRDLVQLMPEFYTGTDPDPADGMDSGFPDGAGILSRESRLSNKGSNIFLCTSRITGRLIQELITVKQQQRNPELYYIVPPGLKAGEALNAGGPEDKRASLEVLDDRGIRYHIITAEAVRQQGGVAL